MSATIQTIIQLRRRREAAALLLLQSADHALLQARQAEALAQTQLDAGRSALAAEVLRQSLEMSGQRIRMTVLRHHAARLGVLQQRRLSLAECVEQCIKSSAAAGQQREVARKAWAAVRLRCETLEGAWQAPHADEDPETRRDE